MAGVSDPMKWKQFFGQYGSDVENNREIQTYDNMMAEYAGIVGVPIRYYTLNIDDYKDNLDPIYGENSNPIWDRAFMLTALLEEWSQEVQNFSAFGLENIDELTMFIHRSTFDKFVGWRSNLAPIESPNLTPRPSRRGSYGPAPKDIIHTLHNDFYYEVVTGGLHFLESNAQHFGHKFWYKLTLKQRQVSTPTVGFGEQYGQVSDYISLQELARAKGLPDDYYTGNPQSVVPTPDCDDIHSPFPNPNTTGTIPTTSSPPSECGTVEYQTLGGPAGPIDIYDVDDDGNKVKNLPADYYTEDGRVADKYKINGPETFSNKGENEIIQQSADQVVDPQSNLNVYKDLPSGRTAILNSAGVFIYEDNGEMVDTNSEDYRNIIGYNRYGPTGKVIRHNRDLWGDW